MAGDRSFESAGSVKPVCVLGLGVIGTTYAYALSKAGIGVEHLVRESKRDTAPASIGVSLLDGRKNPKGEEKKQLLYLPLFYGNMDTIRKENGL